MLAFFVTALVRGELEEAWNWSDLPVGGPKDGEVKAVDGVKGGSQGSKASREKTA
jgi:hypothetical protein